MIILLDIDGVLETTPSWRKTAHLEDGFMKFNQDAVNNLAKLLADTNAEVVLSSTHRISYSIEKWKELFATRGLYFHTISKLNDKTRIDQLLDRGTELLEWVNRVGYDKNYVIIDDDLSVGILPSHIKSRWVQVTPHIGFTDENRVEAMWILMGS